MGDGNVGVTEHCLLGDIKARVTHVERKCRVAVERGTGAGRLHRGIPD
jgi:hypothetical protein